MPKPLRFTGTNPPPELWRTYPNWKNAYDEEGEPGQDETTLMPHEVQTHIAPHTSFTAATVRFNDGRRFPAFCSIGRIGIDGCEVYETGAPWRIYYSYPQKKWVPFLAEWLPETERPPHVSLGDSSVFPLEIKLQVPWQGSTRPSAYRVTPDGQIQPEPDTPTNA
jgi:hypothetical protein